MNYKLFSIGYCFLALNSLVYSSDTSTRIASSDALIRRGIIGRDSSMNANDMAYSMFEQNFGAVRELRVQYETLSLEHVQVTTSLKYTEEDLVKTKAELNNQRDTLTKKLEEFRAQLHQREQEVTQELLRREQQHNIDKIEIQGKAAEAQARIQNDYAAKQLDAQARYHKQIVITALISAAAGWGFAKITSGVDSVGSLFGSISNRIFGSKPQ